MNTRYCLLTACLTQLLLACGGDVRQTGTGGAAGSANAAGGQLGQAGNPRSSGGNTSRCSAYEGCGGGGSPNGGSPNDGSGGAKVCCAAAPICAPNERRAEDSECPGRASCHQVSICCSTIWCVANDGSSGMGGSGGSPTHDCNGLSCTATQACVAYRTLGGPLFLADSGTCPTGMHLQGDRCEQDFAYQCAELHGACQGQAVSCACAQPPSSSSGACPSGYSSCSQSQPTVEASAQIICQKLVP